MAKKTTFPIKTNDGIKHVEGYTFGPFGIRREESGIWHMTHLASGFKMEMMRSRTLTKAKDKAEKLDAMSFDWYTEDVREKMTRETMDEIRSIASLF